MARPFFPPRLGLALGLVLALSGSVSARDLSPRDELLRFVPEDVGFCLTAQNLRAHAAALRDSPFAGRFWASDAGKALAGSQELGQLKKVAEQLRAVLGVGPKELADEVFGDAVAFAYRPGPPGRPEDERGLILLRARNGEILARLIGRINKLQMDSGELTALREGTFKGVRYVTRVEAGGKKGHYFLSGPVLVYSAQEAMLHDAIACRQRVGARVPPLAQRFAELEADNALLAVWLNPRAFDAAVEADVARAEGARAKGLRHFALYWKALDSVGLTVHLDRDLHLALTLRGRTTDLPPQARRLLAAASRPSALWAHFPEEPLLALAGRVDVGALLEVIGGFLPEEEHRRVGEELNRSVGAILGKDLIKEILPALGPDWGFCLAPPEGKAKADWFPQVFLGLAVTPGADEAPTDQALVSALVFWARLFVLGHNKTNPEAPLSIRTTRQGEARVQYLVGDAALPPGFQPALSLRDGYLLLASSPAVLARFFSGTAKKPAAPDESGFPLVRISFRRWREYLTDHREAIAQNMAKKHDMPPPLADKNLGELLGVLPILDRLELRQRTAPGRCTLTLSLVPTDGLRRE